MNNLISVICKELGLEINEEFEVKGLDDSIFKFTESKLLQKIFDKEWGHSNLPLNLLLDRVIKLPFEPKKNERYWTYFGAKFYVDFTFWDNTLMDYAIKNADCVFRTKEEAIKARPQKFKELTGREYVE